MLVLALGVAIHSGASAQTRNEFQAWNAGMLTADLGPDQTPGPALWLDLHVRQGERDRVHIVRPGLGLNVTPYLSLWGGYAWIPVSPDEGSVSHEHRIWQQMVLQFALAHRVKFMSRTRYEQRFSEDGDDVGLRLRQMLRASWQPDPSIPIGVVAWDEIFFGLNDTDWGPEAGFDQNRLFVGPMLRVNSWARFEVGYLLAVLDRDPDVIAHALSVNFFGVLRPPPTPVCSTGCVCSYPYGTGASQPSQAPVPPDDGDRSWFREEPPPNTAPDRPWFRSTAAPLTPAPLTPAPLSPAAPAPERTWFPTGSGDRSWFR